MLENIGQFCDKITELCLFTLQLCFIGKCSSHDLIKLLNVCRFKAFHFAGKNTKTTNDTCFKIFTYLTDVDDGWKNNLIKFLINPPSLRFMAIINSAQKNLEWLKYLKSRSAIPYASLRGSHEYSDFICFLASAYMRAWASLLPCRLILSPIVYGSVL